MDITSFFEAIEHHYSKNLPFVVYRKPNHPTIKYWLQKDSKLHKTEAFTESGFVFAPFDLNQKSILFPQTDCLYSEINCDDLNVESVESTEIISKENDRIHHIDLVSKGIESIKNDNLEKVVLSRCETKSLQDKNPITIFKRLFNFYKNAMVYCWFHPKVGLWIGATPELLFNAEGRRFTTMSLAGTQAINASEAVKWTSKEMEEQQIVTDFITKQIEPYTENIHVSDVETVSAGKLFHLRTRIKSVMKDKVQLGSIIEALHPTPAVCGFPKAEAKAYIVQHENYNRAYYTGFLGELNLKKTTTRNSNRRNVENNAYTVVKIQSSLYVNLRCMQLIDCTANIYVGGGITRDSNPEHEWEETVNKTSTINTVLN